MLNRVTGLDQTFADFSALPNAAQNEFSDMLGRLGRDILALQRARVARATGALAAGLSSQLIRDDEQIRLRVGLLGVAATSRTSKRREARTGVEGRNLGDIYYGRFVEFGRSAQTVLVERRRRVNGMLRTEPGSRGKRKRLSDIYEPYKMHVSAMAPRPFVNTPDGSVDALIDQRTADFWARSFARAGV